MGRRGVQTMATLPLRAISQKRRAPDEVVEPASKRARRGEGEHEDTPVPEKDSTYSDYESNANPKQNQFPTPRSPSPDPDDIRFQLRPNIYHCTFDGCNRSFNRPCRLADHTRSHTGERPFACDYPGCDKSFSRDSHLSRHVKTAHSNIRNFVCTWEGCDKSYATGQKLREHLKSHEKKKEFTCNGYSPCAEVFRKRSTLQAHIASAHLGVKPFPCPHTDEATGGPCKKAYDTQGKLNGHISKYHSGDRYLCTICSDAAQPDDTISLPHDGFSMPPTPASTTASVSFSTYKLLQQHIATIHPLPCPHCNIPVSSARDLTSHIEYEHPDFAPPKTEEPPKQIHLCTIPDCGKPFSKKSNLTTHIRTVHEKSKPFVCGTTDLSDSARLVLENGELVNFTSEEGCGRAYATKAMLENHVRTQHLGLENWEKFSKRQRQLIDGGGGEGEEGVRDSGEKILARKPVARMVLKNSTSVLTGVGYSDSGRNIACLIFTCEYRFYREYDLQVHCASKHGMAEVEIEEAIREREALSGGVFWVGGVPPEQGGRDRFGVYEDDEGGYGEYEEVVEYEEGEELLVHGEDRDMDIPVDPALMCMSAVAAFVHGT